jgi:hypothetical protein
MTAIALEQAYESVGTLTGQFTLPPGKKSISSMKQAICLTTDEKSFLESCVLLSTLSSIQDLLPTTSEGINVLKIKQQLDIINDNLAKVNYFLEYIKNLFDDGADIEKDDDNFINLMCNMQQSQKTLSYIADYLHLVYKIQKAQSEPAQEFTFDELSNFLKAA